ncbi:STAS-like domain-containing protein [Methyloglobulus sp.]|uniref:STAS-like domain-containing protein n=1 Tax=Methyloglobulus sp. TaxID=2518622 RepID=UPI0039894DB9
MDIDRINDKIIIVGAFDKFPILLSYIHTAINKAGYSEIVLDFSDCTSAFQNAMLSVCAQIMAYRKAGVYFSLELPKDNKLSNLFKNTGWAYFIDPRRFDPPIYRGYSRIPVTQYQNPSEQQNAVNKIVNVILGAIPEMQRSDFAAFEWSINEITDNVLVHSDSPIGGLIQLSTFKNEKQVQFVVADAGVGIPKTLKQGHPEITSDTDALDKAIREGVTRDKKIGQGNGLFGSYQICSKSRGYFSVHSGHACLEFTEKKGLRIVNENIPYDGTLVVATIDFTQPKLLEEALRFGGKKYSPVDYVETQYEKSDDGMIRFILKTESDSFGSRVSGKPVRNKLTNLLRMGGNQKIIIDLADIALVSSSFADEAFGKLFLEVGPIAFMQKIEFINVMDTVRHLIDKAISQRVSVGVVD